jgi:hypothetical protein
MLKILVTVVAVLALTTPVLATTASKTGEPVTPNAGPSEQQHQILADWTYNTGGSPGFVPDMGGSATGWAEWFITTVQNNTGSDMHLVEFGFPCAGPPTGTYGWIVWMDMGGDVPPAGPASTADYYGSFTPLDPDPNTFPPTTYTYVDVSSLCLTVFAGEYFCFGYDNTGMGGMTSYNGEVTWGWYAGIWDPDPNYGRTAILQVSADFGATAATANTWSGIKALYR